MGGEKSAKYNMKAVASIVGLQPGTIRAWERRYELFQPLRNDAGHRIYTEEQVQQLKWLAQKVQEGFTISQAVQLFERQIVLPETNNQQEHLNTDHVCDQLLQALLTFDESTSHKVLDQSFNLYTQEKVMLDILSPVLLQIGKLWEDGKITTAHEHFATSILRTRIFTLMQSYPANPLLPKIIAVCAPGEWHELGLLIFSIFLRRKGFQVIYLGSSIKYDDMEVVISEVQPKYLFMSVTRDQNLGTMWELIQELTDHFPSLTIGVGGGAIERLPEDIALQKEAFIIGNNVSSWNSWLEEQVGK